MPTPSAQIMTRILAGPVSKLSSKEITARYKLQLQARELHGGWLAYSLVEMLRSLKDFPHNSRSEGFIDEYIELCNIYDAAEAENLYEMPTNLRFLWEALEQQLQPTSKQIEEA